MPPYKEALQNPSPNKPLPILRNKRYLIKREIANIEIETAMKSGTSLAAP